MKPFTSIIALVALVSGVIVVPTTVDASTVKVLDTTSTIQIANKATTVEDFNNPTQPTIDIRTAQAAGTIEVKLGHIRTHVGDVRGSDAYQFMFQALQSLCHPENGQCCEPRQQQCSKTFKIAGEYGRPGGSRGSYGDVWITILVVNSGWDKSYGIWKLMMVISERRPIHVSSHYTYEYGTIAAIFEQATLNPQNCHHINTGDHTYCNSGDFIGVTVPGGKDTNDKKSYLEIFIRSDGYESHDFDCVALLTPANDVVDRLKGEYEMWLDKRPLDRNVYCV